MVNIEDIGEGRDGECIEEHEEGWDVVNNEDNGEESNVVYIEETGEGRDVEYMEDMGRRPWRGTWGSEYLIKRGGKLCLVVKELVRGRERGIIMHVELNKIIM